MYKGDSNTLLFDSSCVLLLHCSIDWAAVIAFYEHDTAKLPANYRKTSDKLQANYSKTTGKQQARHFTAKPCCERLYLP